MGTSVINKLRIQGSSASFGDPASRRAKQNVSIDACATPKRFAFHQATNNIGKVRSYNSPNISHPNSAPSRRQSFLQRVQEANRGLTSSDHSSFPNDYTSEKNTIHFLLRGKPVNGEYETNVTATSASSPFPHKRVGNYKTSTTEQYRSRHRFRDMADFYEDSVIPNTSTAVSQNDDFFYLGPDSSPIPNALHPNRRTQPTYPPQTAPNCITDPKTSKVMDKDYSRDNKPSSFSESKSLISEGTLVLSEYDNENQKDRPDFALRDFHDFKQVLYPTPIPTKRRQTRSRNSYPDTAPPARPLDPTLLKECLFVQQPVNSPGTETAEEIHRHKKGFRGKVTTPARHNKTLNNKNNKSLGITDNNNRYLFNSVESYVHFNKIYPQVDTHSSTPITAAGMSSKIKTGAHFPRMEGFSPHCTDTLLLKMMFEMNKPPRSVKSVSKYSDVAVHKDLDEFVIVGTPSISRSASGNSSGHGLKP